MKLDTVYRERDRIVALGGAGLSVLVITDQLVSPSRDLNVLLAVSLILVFCIVWLRVRNRESLKEIQLPTRGVFFLSSATAFFLFFGLSLLSLHLRAEVYVRPTSYFVFTAVMAGMVAVEVLTSPPGRRSAFAILAQTVVLGFSVQASQLVVFPNVIGIDPWMHEWVTSTIINTGHIQANTAYTNLPLFHLDVASTALMASLDYKLSAMLSVGLCFVVVGALFTFLLGKSLISEKVGLLGALVLVTASSFIWLGSWAIPNTLGALLLLVVIYEILRLRDQNAAQHIAIIFLAMAALVFTHTLSAVALAIALFVGVLAQWQYQRFHHSEDRTYLSLSIALAFVVGVLLWWINVSGSFSDLIELLRYSAAAFAQTAATSLTVQSPSEQVFSFIGLYAFFALSLIGCLYMISEKFGDSRTFVFVVMGVPIFLLTFSNVFGILLLQERWAVLAQMFFAIPLALTLVLFTRFFKGTMTKSGLVGVIVLCLTFVMILSPLASTDNHILSPSQERLSLSTSELQAIATISQKTTGQLLSDDYYMPAVTYYYHLTNTEKVAFQINSTPNDLLLVRSAEIGKPVTLTVLGETTPISAPQLISPSGSLVYDAGSVRAYRQS